MKKYFRGAIVGLGLGLFLQFVLFVVLYDSTAAMESAFKPGAGKAAALFLPAIITMFAVGLFSVFTDNHD